MAMICYDTGYDPMIVAMILDFIESQKVTMSCKFV